MRTMSSFADIVPTSTQLVETPDTGQHPKIGKQLNCRARILNRRKGEECDEIGLHFLGGYLPGMRARDVIAGPYAAGGSCNVIQQGGRAECIAVLQFSSR
jgi:hypothetical protein